MRLAFRLAAYLVALSILVSCNDKGKKQSSTPDSGFGQYVSRFTSGVISVKAPVIVELNKEPKNPKQPGTEADGSLITLSPAVKGTVQWLDAHTLSFTPSEPMKSDTKYEVKVALGKVLDVPDQFKVMKFPVTTIRQSFTVNDLAVKAFDDQDLKWQYLSGTVHTADVASDEKVEQLIKVTLNNQPVSLTWEHNGDGRNHRFTTDSLQRANSTQELDVSWNGKPLSVDKEGSQKVELPALDEFKVTDVRVVQQPQQYLSLRFSDPLDKDQNLEGLVTIDKSSNLRFVVDNNELQVFPPEQLTGEHQIYISEGIRNALGYKLGQSSDITVRFQDLKPAVKFVGKGTIMPSSEGLILPFEAVNLRAIDLRVIKIYTNNIHQFFQDNQYDGNSDIKRVGRLVLQKQINLNVSSFSKLKSWNTYKIDLAKLIKIEPGAIYRVQIQFHKDFSVYGMSQLPDNQTSSIDELEASRKREKDMEQWDEPGWYSDYYYPPGYDWSQRDNPENVSYYNSNRFVAKNLFATNLGIIAKGGNDKSMNFAVSNLKTTEPESGVQLKIYNYQDQLMETLTTDADGFATVQLKNKPFLLVAEKDGQYAYLRLDDGSSLSLSNFDISGGVVQKGIKGYIYGERGVWRPGDRIYLTFILEDKNHQLPEQHPVIFEFINPKGQTMSRQVKTAGENGFYCFTTKTDADAPTGNWHAVLKVGGQTFTKRIKVETVKPNRLKINLDFHTKQLVYSSEPLHGTLKATWLHGGIAKNLKARIAVNFSAIKTAFPKYANYHFDDPSKDLVSEEQNIFDGRLDEKGETGVDFKLPKLTSAPGMLNAFFTTRVFEETGDFSIDVQKIKYTPYSSFVGIKLPASESGWYKTETTYPLDIVTVDPEGKPISRKGLKISVYKVDWCWWWDSGEDHLARYVTGNYRRPVLQGTVNTVDGKGKVSLKIPYKNWDDNGRYLIYVKDPVSGHSTGITAYFSKWGGWATDGMQGMATMLAFKADKDKYQVGDKVTVTIPSGKSGRALVSLENGSKVLKMFWVKTKEKNTTFQFDVTPDMAPNIFIHISLIQPHAQTENDAPIRLYGVIPIMVEDPTTHLNPQIEMPDELAPEKPYEVKVSEKNGRKMTYTLAVVDEGLLDLTRFQTPNPWPVFYAREALGVKTWDYYDDVIGAYGARLEKAFAVGGDQNLAASKRKKVNRFEPVAQFIGPFTLGKNQTQTHTLKMPNYIGAVRVMVVAGNDGAYGNADKSVKVIKPLMLLGTLPRVLGPGEEVKFPVNVFAMKPEVKDVTVKVETNNLFTTVGNSTQKIHFDEVGDQLAGFNLKVADKTGIGEVKITAQSGKYTASYQIKLNVRPSNPRVTNVSEQLIQPGKTWETPVKAPGMEGTNTASLELSGIPPLDLSRRLDYLIHYPHGCVEQVTSAVFPQLMLDRLIEIPSDKEQEIEDNIRAALNKLTTFQLSNGGFGYWPGSAYASPWGSNYAGHFMLKAEEAGYTLPYGMKSKWLNYQQNMARNWENGSNRYRQSALIQAYRLYTLALAQHPDMGAMNRLREEKDVSTIAKWRLAAAYAVAGQPEVSSQIISGLSREVKPYRELYGTYGSNWRDEAMILETLSLMNRKAEAFPLVTELAHQLSTDDWMSTQTTAYSLIAIAEFAGKQKLTDKLLKASVAVNQSSAKAVETNKPLWQQSIALKNNQSAELSVKNETSDVMYARVTTEGIPVTGDTTSVQSNLFMNVRYTDMQGNKIDPSKLEQGTDFVAVVTVQNPGQRGIYREMALTTIFPSGWEIINQRLNDVPSSLKNDAFDYQDIRDDRVNTYFELKPNERKTFRVMLNAAYEGKFYLPSVLCQAMYDNRITARRPGEWVEVVK